MQPGCWYLKYFVFGDIHYNAAGNVLVTEAVSRNLSAVPVVKREVPASGADSANGQSQRAVRPAGQLHY
jgi:hypothetical protein